MEPCRANDTVHEARSLIFETLDIDDDFYLVATLPDPYRDAMERGGFHHRAQAVAAGVERLAV